MGGDGSRIPSSEGETIDVTFDFRTDAGGRDPDSHSPTLRRYHQLLWSKQLPGGHQFDLSVATPGVYLHHHSDLGEYFLSSDSVMQTFIRWPAVHGVTRQLPDTELKAFFDLGYTIGGMMVFPGNQIQRKWTINQARGCLRRIADRFDLTLDCIRRHYVAEASPMSATLERYQDFFALFGDFRGYVDFFLLQDLVDHDLGIRFFTPFDDFQTSAVPKDVDTYRGFRHRSMEFNQARNERIAALRF